jgi:ABC-type lipoprotein export system ATPase subunit
MDEMVVRLDGVTRTFTAAGGSLVAVRNANLAIPRGAFVTIAGPSGSGKTTLLNLAGALDQPTSGSVTLLGEQVGRLAAGQREALRRRVGFLFQSFALLGSCSAYENVELALRLSGELPRAQWDGRVRRCLQAVGLDPWRDHRPNELSGGQQQRVALARALAIRPPLLLADEPTGDLDRATAGRICTLLRELSQQTGMALLVATHDPLVEAHATARYTMRDGVLTLDEPLAATTSELPPR